MLKKTSRILLNILASTLGLVVGFFILLAVYLNSTSGQKRLSSYVSEYLSKKINSPVRAHITYGFPDWVNLDDLLIIDQNKDTLISAKKAHFDIDMLALFNNQIQLNKIDLDHTAIHLNDKYGSLNYQYILDAFAGDPNDTSKSTLKYHLTHLKINNFKLKYDIQGVKAQVVLNDLKTGFDKLNPEKNQYYLKPTLISGLNIYAQKQNDSKIKQETQKSTDSVLPDFRFSEIKAQNIHYKLEIDPIVAIGQNINLNLIANDLNLPQEKAQIDQLVINAKSISLKNTSSKSNQNTKEINFDDLELQNAHLNGQNIAIHSFTDIKGMLKTLEFSEKCGFDLKNTETEFSFKNQKLELKDLNIATNNSTISARLVYTLDSGQTKNSNYEFTLNKSLISPKDALFFSSTLNQNPYFKNLSEKTVQTNGQFTGNLNEIYIEKFNLQVGENSAIDLKGKVKNFQKPTFDIFINELKTTKNDIEQFVPTENLPQDIRLPQNIKINGEISGNLNDLTTNIFANSSEGTARIKLNLHNLSGNPTYNGNLIMSQLNAGHIANNADLGKVNGYLNFDGRGFENPKVSVNGKISEVDYQNKKYQNITFDSQIENQILDAQVRIDDATARINWEGKVDLRNPQVSVIGKTKVDFINLQALGLTEQNIEIRGDLNINELVIDKESPKINISGKQLLLYKNDQLFPIGNLYTHTANANGYNQLILQTDFIDLKIGGNFTYDNLSQIFLSEINKYFKLPDFQESISNKIYDVNIEGKIEYDPVFTALIPSLQSFEKLNLKTRITSENTLLPISGQLTLAALTFDSTKLSQFELDFSGNGNTFEYKANLNEILQQSFRVRNAALSGTLHDNIADFNLEVKDSLNQSIHALHGIVNSIDNTVRVSFDEEGSRLFYEPWSGNPYGYFEYSAQGIRFYDVIFTHNNQQIVRINSLNDTPNGPLSVFTRGIDLNFFSKAVFRDSNYVSGLMDLDLELVGYMDSNLTFTGDMDIKNLSYEGQKIGDLNGVAKSISDDNIYINASVNSDLNKLELNGNFWPKRKENLGLKAHITQLDAQTLQIFTSDILKEMKGGINGNFNINGSTQQPLINGEIRIDDLQFRLVETNALLKIKNQKARFEDMILRFKNFEINDQQNHSLTLDGQVVLNKLPDYQYNLEINSKDLKLIDATKGQNPLYFGEGYFDSQLKIIGKNLDFKLTGDVKIGEKTNLTLLLEEESEAASELASIIEFVDFDQKSTKSSSFQNKKDSQINFANAINLNIEIPQKATLNILMDPLTGDLLTVNGDGKLNVGFGNTGDLFLIGQYNINSGKYALTYQVIKKEFEINSYTNSNIVWTGDPMKGQMNITASYSAPRKVTPPFTEEELKNLKLSIPVRIDLVLNGIIESPEVNFEIAMFEKDLKGQAELIQNQGYRVITEKNEILQATASNYKKSEINNQAVILLLTGEFSPEKFFQNLEQAANYEDIARKKASELISGELNKYAAGLIKGIDLNLGLESGYNANSNSRNTNLNLGVSKKLANDRLILSVGKNFELENKEMRSDEIFDNLQANWIISKDGRYRLNVFRKTQNDMVLEGAVVETGLGLIVAIDYETWRELMKRNKN